MNLSRIPPSVGYSERFLGKMEEFRVSELRHHTKLCLRVKAAHESPSERQSSARLKRKVLQRAATADGKSELNTEEAPM